MVQKNCKNEAACDAPSQLEPHRVKRYLLADPFALRIAAVQVIRQYRQHRAEKKFKHASAPSALRSGDWFREAACVAGSGEHRARGCQVKPQPPLGPA